MIRKIRDDLIQIRGWFVNSYILVEENAAFIIDGGFVGDLKQIERALAIEGLGWNNIKGILMTHGHLDHTFNVGPIQSKIDAPVYGHLADALHFHGAYPYRGQSRICGWLETIGRSLFGYTPVSIDKPIQDGDVLPIWGGLRSFTHPATRWVTAASTVSKSRSSFPATCSQTGCHS